MRQSVTVAASKFHSFIVAALVLGFLVTLGQPQCWGEEGKEPIIVRVLMPKGMDNWMVFHRTFEASQNEFERRDKLKEFGFETPDEKDAGRIDNKSHTYRFTSKTDDPYITISLIFREKGKLIDEVAVSVTPLWFENNLTMLHLARKENHS